MTDRFTRVLAALNEAGVRYVVVGGLAVILHGHPRMTTDLDLVVDLATEEAERAIRTLQALGLVPRAPVRALDFADAEKREKWVSEKHMVAFSLHHPLDPLMSVDLLMRPGIPFDDLFASSVVVTLGSTSVHVCSLDHLIELKQSSGRPQDLQDLKGLRRQTGEETRGF